MSQLQSVTVRRFKAVEMATFDLSSVNVLVGANNSGKSSILQAMHFAVGLLQSIKLDGKLAQQGTLSVSLSPTQLLYSPCEDLYSLGNGGRLQEAESQAVEVQFVLDTGSSCAVKFRKGRNRNIIVGIDSCEAAGQLASLEHPFTIFSPGLAGIAKTEQYESDGVVLRTIARGDANLVLRNILWRLWKTQGETDDKWVAFTEDFSEVFPGITFDVSFNERTDEFIKVGAIQGGLRFPLELAGTGVLQGVQILSYIHCFSPSAIVLDEPDSHLHPNNQRLLCSLLSTVAIDRGTQVLLATHSRHVVDALSGQVRFLWARNATVEAASEEHDLAILLDIGALDVKELVGQTHVTCIVLTEDSLKRPLESLVEGSGFDMRATVILPYHGCTSVHNLRALLGVVRATNGTAKVIVHRDRDYLTDAEAAEWETAMRGLQVEPFLTVGVDIESHHLNAQHLSALNPGTSVEQVNALINQATSETRTESIRKYVNGRVDLEKKRGTFGSLDVGRLAAEAPGFYDSSPDRFRHSKTVMKKVRDLYRVQNGKNMVSVGVSEALGAPELVAARQRIRPRAKQGSGGNG